MQSGTISQAVVEEKALHRANTTKGKHFEGCSQRSHRLIAFLFSSTATMARLGCGDQYAGVAEGNGDKESIDRSLEPPIYMLVSLVKHTVVAMGL